MVGVSEMGEESAAEADGREEKLGGSSGDSTDGLLARSGVSVGASQHHCH